MEIITPAKYFENIWVKLWRILELMASLGIHSHKSAGQVGRTISAFSGVCESRIIPANTTPLVLWTISEEQFQFWGPPVFFKYLFKNIFSAI